MAFCTDMLARLPHLSELVVSHQRACPPKYSLLVRRKEPDLHRVWVAIRRDPPAFSNR